MVKVIEIPHSARLLLAGVMLASVGSGCASHARSDDQTSTCAAARARVEHARDQFLAAWTKKPGEPFTTDGLAQWVMTSPDFVSFDGMSQDKTVISGWADYAAIWGRGMNGFTRATLSHVRSVRVWAADAMAVTASIVRIHGELPNGQTLDTNGHLTLVWTRGDDDRWRVVHEHMSLPVKE